LKIIFISRYTIFVSAYKKLLKSNIDVKIKALIGTFIRM
jgi:hypothetical protein